MHDFIQALKDAIALVGSRDPELVQIVALALRVSLSASDLRMPSAPRTVPIRQ
jgi:ABC-type tungstate transport system substrate-binding protein